ncbi:MAG: hypothetical protein OXR73_20125 [Myxococcales bacterium]|nr:hypothetical protein [Myxococcales bacterium]
MSRTKPDRANSRASDAEALGELGPEVAASFSSIPPLSDVSELGKLVAAGGVVGSQEGSSEGAAPRDDDGRVDLAGARAEVGDTGEPGDADAGADDTLKGPPTAEVQASSRAGSHGPGWGFGAALGLGLGFGLSAGWFVFGGHMGASVVAADEPQTEQPASDGLPAPSSSTAHKHASREGSPSTGPAGDVRAGRGEAKRSISSTAERSQSTSGNASAMSSPAGVGTTEGPTGGPGLTSPPARSRVLPLDPVRDSAPSTGTGPARSMRQRSAAKSPVKPTGPGGSSVAGRTKPPARPPHRAAKAAAPSDERKASSRSVDRLLDDALAGSDQTAYERAKAASALPATPSKQDLVKAMKSLLPAIRACAMGQTGVATVSLAIANSGRVQAARITDAPFAGTAAGRCIEGVARKARFSRFAQAVFRVRVPLALQ